MRAFLVLYNLFNKQDLGIGSSYKKKAWYEARLRIHKIYTTNDLKSSFSRIACSFSQMTEMAEELMEKLRSIAEGQIDFEGQKLAELLATVVLILVGAISFAVAFFLEDISLIIYIGLGGTALAFLLIVPPWPFYKNHPVIWLAAAAPGNKASGFGGDNIVVK